jgi:hypothetical protein
MTPGGGGRVSLFAADVGREAVAGIGSVFCFLFSAAAAADAAALALSSMAGALLSPSCFLTAVCRRLGLWGFGWEVLVVSNVAREKKVGKANVRHEKKEAKITVM